MPNTQVSALSPQRATVSMAARIGRATPISGALLLSSALLLGAGTTAQAAPGAGDNRFPMSVESMDARRTEVFAAIDTNGDGLISAEEFDAHERAPRAGSRGSRSQTEGGQRMHHRARPSAEQIAVMDELLFHQLDSDSDGVLSRDEFSQEAMMTARRDLMKERIFAQADQNEDGYLSPDEFPPRRLTEMDINGDGEISRDELREHRHPSAS